MRRGKRRLLILESHSAHQRAIILKPPKRQIRRQCQTRAVSFRRQGRWELPAHNWELVPHFTHSFREAIVTAHDGCHHVLQPVRRAEFSSSAILLGLWRSSGRSLAACSSYSRALRRFLDSLCGGSN